MEYCPYCNNSVNLLKINKEFYCYSCGKKIKKENKKVFDNCILENRAYIKGFLDGAKAQNECGWTKEELVAGSIKIRNPYEQVPDFVYAEIWEEAKKIGYTPVNVYKKSNHPDDYFTFIVIASKDNEFAYFVYNSKLKGLYDSSYNLSFKEAIRKMADNLWDYKDI